MGNGLSVKAMAPISEAFGDFPFNFFTKTFGQFKNNA
jgi:hypothetical protein